MKAFFPIFVVFGLLIQKSETQNEKYALVLEQFIYDKITKYCSDSSSYSYEALDVDASTYFIMAPPSIVTPYDVTTSFLVYNYLLQNNNYTAIVATYSNFLPSIAVAFNMLYYVYDYNDNSALNMMLEQVNETGYQVSNSILTKNVRLSYAYYNLFQIAAQLIYNTNNDPILQDFFTSALVYIICESASDAKLFISATSERALLPIIIAIDEFIVDSAYSSCQGDMICSGTLTCAETCQLYQLVSSIQQGINGGVVATIFVILKSATQQKYFPLISEYSYRLGLFSSNVLWIFAELWLPSSKLIPMTGAASPIYVINVPELNTVSVEKFICTDFVNQVLDDYYDENGLLCSISKRKESDECPPEEYFNIFYSGYMPIENSYVVRRLMFQSKGFFEDSFDINFPAPRYNLEDTPSGIYVIPALPTEEQYLSQTGSQSSTTTGLKKNSVTYSTWLPNANKNCSSSILTPAPVALKGSSLLETTDLNRAAIYALGTLYEPLLMRVDNYDAMKQKLIQQNLVTYGYSSSMIILYPTENGCSDFFDSNNYNWCFYNASGFGIQLDPTYAIAYANATVLAGNSSISLCTIDLLLPFMDNLNLYTGFSADVLRLVQKYVNFSINIIETTEPVANIAKLISKDDRVAISAEVLSINTADSNYVNFLSSSLTSGIDILMSNQTFQPTWQVLFPFGGFVWVLIVVGILFISITFTIIDYIAINDAHYQGFKTMFAYTYASFTQGAIDWTPRRLSARVLSMLLWFAVMLLLSSYTSAMSVVLLTPPSDGCVSGLFDLLTCNVMFNIEPNSVAQQMLSNQQFSNLTANRKFYGNFSQIMQYFNADNNLTDFKHFAYVEDASFNKYYYAKYCSTMNISLIGQPQYTQFRAFAVPKNAAYQSSINAALLRGAANGMRNTISKKWFPDPPSTCTFKTTAKPLNLTDMAGLYFILLIGCVVAALSVTWEVLRRRYTIRSLRRQAPQLEFGQVYEATVLNVRLEGVDVDIKAQPEIFFIPFENLNFGNIQLQFPSELGIRDGTTIYLKYFGVEKKSKAARFILVKIENTNNPGLKSILTSTM